jgi:hypothetical protein
MDIDTLLADTFAAHEHLTPSEDDVLAAVHERIRHGRSAYIRPLTVAATVVVVAAAVGGAVALSRHGGHGAARHVHAAIGRNVAGDATAAKITPLTMPYDLGWLPAGAVDYLARRVNVGAVSQSSPPLFDGEYLLTVTTPDTTLGIDVQQFPGNLQDAAFKSGPGSAVTIDGRPGIESTNSAGPAGYEVYFNDAVGGLMYVSVAAHRGEAAAATQLAAIGRQVAANIRFPGASQISPSFGVGYVPDGLRVRAFDVETASDRDLPVANGASGPSTSYELGTSTSQQSAAVINSYSGEPSGTPGREVQGRPTRYVDDHGYLTLSVLDAVDGQAVSISSSSLPLAELYAIADGLQLPH